MSYLDANRRLLGELLETELPGISYRAPEGTYLAWLDCTALSIEDPARWFLDQAHVALSDGPAFGAGYGRHLRLNFATSRTLLERIVGAMGRSVRSGAE